VIAHDGAARLDGSQPDVADDDDRFDWLVVEAPDQPAAVSVMHAFEAVESGWGSVAIRRCRCGAPSDGPHGPHSRYGGDRRRARRRAAL